jgi:hypothetical protein
MSACCFVSVSVEGRAVCFTHQVCSHYSIQRLGVKHHSTCHSINEHLIHLHIGEVLGNLRRNLIPHNHAIALGITLSDNRDVLSRPLLSCLKCEADQAFYAVAREDRDFSGNLPGLTAM